MTAIMGTMSEPVRGKSAVGFPSALLAFLSFDGLATARLVIRLRFPKLQTVQCRVKERGGIGDKTVLFAAERGVVPQREDLLVGLRVKKCVRNRGFSRIDL